VTFADGDSRGRTSFLKFKLAAYNIEGKFLGFQDLKSQLSLCSMGYA
jgi:hypothetical protein